GVAAEETHVWLGADRHVHAHPLAPVVTEIRMRGDLGVAAELHQTRTPPHCTETMKHLHQVGTLRERWCRSHRTDNRIAGRISIDRDQRQREVAGILLRMVDPPIRSQRFDFSEQTGSIEPQGKLHKRYVKLHRMTLAFRMGRGSAPEILRQSLAHPAPFAWTGDPRGCHPG